MNNELITIKKSNRQLAINKNLVYFADFIDSVNKNFIGL